LKKRLDEIWKPGSQERQQNFLVFWIPDQFFLMTVIQVIEALLFSAQNPLTIRELADALRSGEGDEVSPNEWARVKEAEVASALGQIKVDYIQNARGFQLAEKADGWQLVSHPDCARWVRQLFPAPKPARLSPPSLETLAIIAYRQPVTRADLEAVRGVTVEGVLQNLMERGLVKINGRAELPGRPLLYGTTQFFLEHFGLRDLDELPNAEELRTRYLPMSQGQAKEEAAGVNSPSPQSSPQGRGGAEAPGEDEGENTEAATQD
jgi:segregation and condensation protein B